MFDRDGNLYVTYSGTRGQQVPVSIFRVRPNGTRETFCTGLVNPTSMALGPGRRSLRVEPLRRDGVSRDGRTARSSRSRPTSALPCGLAFDRRRHAVCRRSVGHDLPRRSRRAGDDACVAAVERGGVPPGVRSRRGALRHRADAVAVRFGVQGRPRRRRDAFGTPGSDGRRGSPSIGGGDLFVVEALAGVSGLYRLPPGERRPRTDAAGPGLVGVAFGSNGARRRVLERHGVSVVTVRLKAAH